MGTPLDANTLLMVPVNGGEARESEQEAEPYIPLLVAEGGVGASWIGANADRPFGRRMKVKGLRSSFRRSCWSRRGRGGP